MNDEDNPMKEKAIKDDFIKKFNSLVKKLREIEEAKGKNNKTKMKEIEETLKRNLPFYKKGVEEIEKAKKKIYPFNSDPLTALSLNREAEQRALKIYKEFYTEKNFTIPSSNCIIPNKLFLKILNDCIILSQQKIEGRNISTQFLFPNLKKEQYNWPKGVEFVEIENISFHSLDLESLKKYLEMATGNTYLVIDISKELFILKGFMFINKSMSHFASTLNKRFSIGGQDLSKQNNCLFNSVIFSIEKGRVSLSYINDTFLIIENGLLMPKDFYEFEIHWILEISQKVSKKRRSILGEKYQWFSTNELVKIYKNEKLDKDSRQSIEKYIISEEFIVESLRNIINKISEARHGTIMIFNFKGNSNDPSLFHQGFIKVKLPYGTKLLELLEIDDPIKLLKKEKQELMDIIRKYEEAIVSLSFTDGAMVFDQNLDLIMTGAFLKIKSSSSTSGGARRKSAEAFIKDNKETIGLVFSQDGTVTFTPDVNEILNRYPPYADVYKKLSEQFEKSVQNNSKQ